MLKVYAEDSIFDLIDYIQSIRESRAQEITLSIVDIGLLVECYLEDLSELEQLQKKENEC